MLPSPSRVVAALGHSDAVRGIDNAWRGLLVGTVSRLLVPLGGTGSTLSPFLLLLPERRRRGLFVEISSHRLASPVRGGICPHLASRRRLEATAIVKETVVGFVTC